MILAPGPPWRTRLAYALGTRDKLRFLLDCAARYGDVVDLTTRYPTYLLNNADDIKYVLETNHPNYTKTRQLTGARGKRLSGEGLMTSSGEAALQQRRVLQPVLSRPIVAGFTDTIVESTRAITAQWDTGLELDIAATMLRLTRHIICKMLLGVDLLHTDQALAEALTTRRQYIQQFFKLPFPLLEYLPTRTTRAYHQAITSIDRTIYGMIHTRRESSVLPQDLLSMLMQVHYKDGTAMTDRQIRDEALTIASTGYETIANALTWTWYLLAQYPSVEKRLADELRTVLNGRAPQADDVPKLRYTEMIFAESMRLYPPTWLFVRVPQQEDVLPSGVTIPASATLLLCPYVTHRNPRYFPNPERFDPERFSDAAKESRPRLAYFPFAGGPRVCLGQGLAMAEGVLILACIAQQATLDLVPQQTIVPAPQLTLYPKHGIRMNVKLHSSLLGGKG